MKINCNYVKCENCNVYDKCNLHKIANFQLLNTRQQLNWSISRFNEIVEGINHFNSTLIQYNQGELSDFVMKHISKHTIQQRLSSLHSEKTELLLEIKRLQTKEKNIIKIINRRTKNEF